VVLCAEDGVQGLLAAQQQAPDLVLCDLQLPGLDGYQVLQALRSEPNTARLPVVAVTAFSMPDDRRRIGSAGFDGYISKPIEPDAFLLQVASFLSPSSSDT